MKAILAVTIFMMLGGGAVAEARPVPSSASGPMALALAAVVGEHSPVLNAPERNALARLFNGEVNFEFPADQKISVTVDAVVCRMSDIDIVDRSCELTFGTHRITLKGRQANELSATASAASARSEGAAGSIITSFSHLSCTIDPHVILQRAGGGADCAFIPGQ